MRKLKKKKVVIKASKGKRGRPKKVLDKILDVSEKKINSISVRRGRPRKEKLIEEEPETSEENIKEPYKRKVYLNTVELVINKEGAVKLKYNDEYTSWFFKNPAVLKVKDTIYVAWSRNFSNLLPMDMIETILEFKHYIKEK